MKPLRSLAPLAESTSGCHERALSPITLAFASARMPLVITGAGISTSSGIPDYRSPNRPVYTPLQHVDFLTKPSTRRRYWARSFLGYPRLSQSEPNPGHDALARLVLAGRLATVITQNVDRLHHKAIENMRQRERLQHIAFSNPLIELHGTIHEVSCMECDWEVSRSTIQELLHQSNAGWRDHWLKDAVARPDGDVEMPEESYSDFRMPQCGSCGAELLKPKVIFHGGTLDPWVREAAAAAAAAADFVLLAGTTVTTYSAFRLVRDAANRGATIAIINFGPTRADSLLRAPEWKVDGHTSPCLVQLADSVLG